MKKPLAKRRVLNTEVLYRGVGIPEGHGFEVGELSELLNSLTDRQRRVMALRHGRRYLTLAETGKEMGISGSRVRQLAVKAYARMRHVRDAG